MKRLPKILLIGSAISFGLGLTGPGSEIWFGILKPTGALMFVVAFIVHIVSRLDPEQYAADQQLREELMRGTHSAEPVHLPNPSRAAA